MKKVRQKLIYMIKIALALLGIVLLRFLANWSKDVDKGMHRRQIDAAQFEGEDDLFI